jgi:hypothetical protein
MPDMIRIDDAGGLILAPGWPAIASLHASISRTMAALVAVEKDGHHGQGYTYTSWDEAAAALRAAMASAALAITTHLVSVTPNDKGITVEIALTLADTETGAMKVIRWTATGADVQKATTTAVKHALTKTFLVAAEHDDQAPTSSATQQRRTPPPATQATAKATPATGTHYGPGKPMAGAAPHVDHATGEITEPAATPATPADKPIDFDEHKDAPAAPAATTTQTMSDSDKRNAVLKEAKRLGWDIPHLNHWLIASHYAPTVGALTNGQLDAALAAISALQPETP